MLDTDNTNPKYHKPVQIRTKVYKNITNQIPTLYNHQSQQIKLKGINFRLVFKLIMPLFIVHYKALRVP